MVYKAKPDYERCVALVTRAALREMRTPGLICVVTPVLVGLTFRFVGEQTNRPLLGAEVLAAYLMFGTVTGILMALFLDTAGGAWDNVSRTRTVFVWNVHDWTSHGTLTSIDVAGQEMDRTGTLRREELGSAQGVSHGRHSRRSIRKFLIESRLSYASSCCCFHCSALSCFVSHASNSQKDTAGPSLHVVIKLLSTTILIAGPLFIANIKS